MVANKDIKELIKAIQNDEYLNRHCGTESITRVISMIKYYTGVGNLVLKEA